MTLQWPYHSDSTDQVFSSIVTLYPITFSIANLLNLDFTFPSPNRQQRISLLPEITLISLLVIATKLYHPFNETIIPRHARSLADPAALRLDWSAWTSAHEAHNVRLAPGGHLPRGTEIHVTEKDIMSMTGDQMDDYLDFYERTFVDEERVENKKDGIPKHLLDMFPTSRADGSAPYPYDYKGNMRREQASIDEIVKSVVGSLQVRPIVNNGDDGDDDDDESEAKIGSFYVRYRRVENPDGNEQAKIFHKTVAHRVRITLETLLVAVSQMERKLMRCREKEVKEGRMTDEDDGEDDGEDEEEQMDDVENDNEDEVNSLDSDASS